MSLKIFPYKAGSMSAKRLARSLGVLRVRPTYNAKRKDVIVNWGSSTPPHFRWMEQDLNKPHAIALASNKLETFREFRSHSFTNVPDWTTNPEEAQHWLDLGLKTYCRRLLSSHSGNGIIICNDGDKLVSAPLYTLHTKHKDEYRVHVFKGEVLDVQKKKKRNGFVGSSTGIRNYSSGWVYARSDVAIPDMLCSIAIQAVNLLGLDFGAVDIGHRLIDNKFFVFEVNTAPGLEGTTLDKYSKAIYNYYRSL
jgi:glutathione synthase/RimK-type ligase-like ATP-grasp enzyme